MSAAVAALLAASLRAAVAREGLEPDPSLRLVRASRHPGALVGTDGVPLLDGPADLGRLHERLTTPGERTRRGAWYTPAELAAALVERALRDAEAAARGPVADPACGGGAFLLAAADRLRSFGFSPVDAVAHLRGGDVDPLAVAVTEAALWWWSARAGVPVVAGDRLVVGDALVAASGPPVGTVVGNPPFLGQLRARTTMDTDRRRQLRRRFGAVVGPYTDPAWLFVLRAVEDVALVGRVALVQPRSVLAARDAGAVRAAIDERATLVDVVLADHGTFDADVTTCGLVLERTDRRTGNDWTGPLADAAGIPAVRLDGHRRLGDLATTHAGFRDEYYGLAAAVAEGGRGPRLVTAGVIDPLTLLDRPQRFAGQRWSDPRVDVGCLTGRAARWAHLQTDPKVLVATQTRVLEAVADAEGALVGSVPVVLVRPSDPADLWRIAALLHAPAASAWLLRRSAGTALSADACRPTAALLADLPVPDDEQAWDAAAAAARDASRGLADVDEVARLADRALGVDDASVHAWWAARRPRR